MTITPEEIARLRALEAKATPGPWEHDAGMPIRSNHPNDYELVSVDVYGYAEFTNPSNSHLIVAMRNALPGILDEIERLRAENHDFEIQLGNYIAGEAKDLVEIERLQSELDFQKGLRVPCECSMDDACKFARERDEARAELAELRAYKERTEAALRAWCDDLTQFLADAESGGDERMVLFTRSEIEDWKEAGLWREPTTP